MNRHLKRVLLIRLRFKLENLGHGRIIMFKKQETSHD